MFTLQKKGLRGLRGIIVCASWCAELCPLHMASVILQVSGNFCTEPFAGCVACADWCFSLLGVLVVIEPRNCFGVEEMY